MADPGVEHAQVPHPTHEVETHVTPTTVEQNAAPAINGHAAPQAEVPAPPPPPAAESPAGPSLTAQALQHARTLATRAPSIADDVVGHRRLSTREWLVRASFALFALVVLGVVVFSALGLMAPVEAIVVLSPVTAMVGMIVGVFLGADDR